MRNGIKAIDFMYYVATPEFIRKWNEAKKGELICRMERASGGLEQIDGLGLKEETKRKLLRGNAVELFGLRTAPSRQNLRWEMEQHEGRTADPCIA